MPVTLGKKSGQYSKFTRISLSGLDTVGGVESLPLRHAVWVAEKCGCITAGIAENRRNKVAQTYGLTVVAANLDEDGSPDIYVACDSTPSLLFINNRDGTFREEGMLRGAVVSSDGMEQAGMGVGVGDYDLDGHLDLFKTHFTDDANILTFA